MSRRIEREQGSTYRINGREVRARDVQILFADASTGARSPALVHQGRIGEIIQAKPEQRRRVLEDAAGISGLHVRRHEAELRLRAAEQNLQRLEDVIGQLASQMSALKRQAREAVRYRDVSAKVRKQEATLYHLRWINANKEVEEADRARDLGTREVAAAMLAQTEAAKKQESVAAALPPLREDEARAAAALQRLVIARETLDREEERARERLAELEPPPGAVQRRHRAREAARDRFRMGAQPARRREGGARPATCRPARTSAAPSMQRVGEADAVLAASEKTFGELTGALADLTARRNQLEGGAREQDERLAKFEREIAEVEAELGEARCRRRRASRSRRGSNPLSMPRMDAVTEAEAARRARRGRAFGGAPGARCRAPAARRSRAAHQPARSRSQGAGARCCMSTPRICGRRSSTM